MNMDSYIIMRNKNKKLNDENGVLNELLAESVGMLAESANVLLGVRRFCVYISSIAFAVGFVVGWFL